MMKRRLLAKLVTLVVPVIMLFFSFTVILVNENSKVEAKTTTNDEKSIFNSIIELVAEKGADIVKENLPTVGDFLCSTIFDFVGIDYTDQYTKKVKELSDKLDSMQKDLSQVLANQNNEKSVNAIRSVLNQVNVFSNATKKAYNYYTNIVEKEKNNELTKAQAVIEDDNLYNKYVSKLIFGSSTSTGDLSFQLEMLLQSIITPDIAYKEITLMEHYNRTYSDKWVFDTQTFEPKKEFIGFISATALQGLTLASFQYTYEYQNATDTEKENLEGYWNDISVEAKNAFAYLKSELDAIAKAEESRSETVFHYATGKLLSKKLYVAHTQNTRDTKNHYTYRSYYNITRQGNIRTLSIITLNAVDLVDSVMNDFTKYKANNNIGDSFTLNDFLKSAGFTCDDWNNNGLYRAQLFRHDGTFMTTEFFRLYINYFNQKGEIIKCNWGDVKYKVLSAPASRRFSDNFKLMAFVEAKDGKMGDTLYGYYQTIHDDCGNTSVDELARLVGYNQVPDQKGKVW